MKFLALLRSVSLATVLGVTVGFAQEAKLTADSAKIAPKGGVITFTATVAYSQTPGALGWAIVLPAKWRLVAVTGINVPEIAPAADATGTLEFAYTNPPSERASFIVSVSYPAGTDTTKVTSTAIVRTDGKLATLTPDPIDLRSDVDGANNDIAGK